MSNTIVLIDKNIHRDEIKLRLLLTNQCTKNCGFCLNDFQKKGKEFLYEHRAMEAITYYTLYFNSKVPLQVYFSGGEPTLHNCLPTLIDYANRLSCRTTLNSNGYNSNSFNKPSCLHIGTYEINLEHAKMLNKYKATLQCVFSKQFPYVNMDFITYYTTMCPNSPIKIFKDFYDLDDLDYLAFAEKVIKKFPNIDISFRHTGIQTNRGKGCNECFACDRDCVTLKAAWVFPDGGVSPCPQLYKASKMYPISPQDWLDTFDYVYDFHKI